MKSVVMTDSVALVTGANRGLGAAFVDALLSAGAKRIYAGARNPASVVRSDRVIPIRLDVTKSDDVAAAAKKCTDVNLLINNAGSAVYGPVLEPSAFSAFHTEWDTNVLGPLRLTQAFAGILAMNGGGAILNVLSVFSWISLPGGPATYSASKAAMWSLTNSLRNELSGQKTLVSALHVALMETDMSRGFPFPKVSPADVAKTALAALEKGQTEILADQLSVDVKGGLSAGLYLTPPTLG